MNKQIRNIKNRAKKTAALIMALMLALLALAPACTPKKIEQQDKPNTDAPVTTAPKNESEKGVVNLSAGVKANSVAGKAADDAFITAQTDFAVRLFQNALKKGENSLVSPLSVMLALAMTANGAGGETLSGMEKALGGLKIDELNEYLGAYMKRLNSSDWAKLLAANSIWTNNDSSVAVRESFLQKNADYYRADIFRADFDNSTLDAINAWVKEGTDGMIERILDEMSPNAVMYLVNTLLFEAEWSRKYFDVDVTEGEFTTNGGEKRNAEFMYSTEHTYLEDELASGFIKPYLGTYAFAALLPNEGVDIFDYIASLNGEKLANTLKNAGDGYIVNAALPKFNFDFSAGLNDALSAMGMELAFDPNSAEFGGMFDFSQMIAAEPIAYIDRVIHKTHIEVGEQGTKAGAATLVEMNAGSAFPGEDMIKTVTLDRPFVFMIIDTETNIPLFIGALTDVD